MLLQSEQEIFESLLIYKYIIPIGIIIIGLFILYRLVRVFEFVYASKFKKPIVTHLSLRLKKLTPKQRTVLKNESSFYKKLSGRHQRYFEHRTAKFIKSNEFIGKKELIVTERMKVLIAATAVMLTFGFRKYKIGIIDKVIIYPNTYFSQINEVEHKGEINPKLKVIVFSWKDFEQGYKIGDDNLNLGIHEFGHAVHLNSINNSDISSVIFKKGFMNLTNYLQRNDSVRKDLINSKYFRTYAYTNQFEFFAVLLENFIETPNTFKAQFPRLYNYMKDMLNFNFAGY